MASIVYEWDICVPNASNHMETSLKIQHIHITKYNPKYLTVFLLVEERFLDITEGSFSSGTLVDPVSKTRQIWFSTEVFLIETCNLDSAEIHTLFAVEEIIFN